MVVLLIKKSLNLEHRKQKSFGILYISKVIILIFNILKYLFLQKAYSYADLITTYDLRLIPTIITVIAAALLIFYHRRADKLSLN